MKCIICNHSMAYYFSKEFNAFNLSTVDYWRCTSCGFVISETHANMSLSNWATLNHQYHSTYQGTEISIDDPRWLMRLQEQATILCDASEIGLISRNGRWLDYACGDGKLSELLEKEGLNLLKYDKYMPSKDDYLRDTDLTPGSFDFVITTSFFEHLTKRDQFDTVEALVSANGVFGIHTMVCEDVPKDPEWFYLLPVHCAFHTNKSMSLLFQEWGYSSSVYHVDSRLCLWFKQPGSDIQQKIERANLRQNKPEYIYKKGFVDYWK